MHTVRLLVAAGLTTLLLSACSGDKPAASHDKADLKKEAEEQKQMHDREVHNR